MSLLWMLNGSLLWLTVPFTSVVSKILIILYEREIVQIKRYASLIYFLFVILYFIFPPIEKRNTCRYFQLIPQIWFFICVPKWFVAIITLFWNLEYAFNFHFWHLLKVIRLFLTACVALNKITSWKVEKGLEADYEAQWRSLKTIAAADEVNGTFSMFRKHPSWVSLYLKYSTYL